MRAENVELQFVVLPSNSIDRCSCVPEFEKYAADFFFPAVRQERRFQRRQADGGRNVLIIEAPALPGLDIPHFEAELNKNGKFFEGYIQHTATGFQKLARYSGYMLNKFRKQAELEAQRTPTDQDEAGDLFLLRSLLTFDRLHQTHPFTIYIEPRDGQQMVDEYKKLRRATRVPPEESLKEEELIESRDLDRLLEYLTSIYEINFKTAAAIHRNREDAYTKFLFSLLGGLKSNKPIRVLVPRSKLRALTSQDKMEKGIKDFGVNFRPMVSLDQGDELWMDRFSKEFIKDPEKKVSRGEALVLMLSTGMIEMYKDRLLLIGSEDEVFNTLGSIPADELESFFRHVLTLEGKEQERVVLNYYGEKRGRGLGSLGIGDIFIGRALDPMFQRLREMLRHEASSNM